MSNNIYFEKFTSEKDFADYWKLVSNEKIMIMNYGRVFTLEEANYLFNYMLETNKKNNDFGYFKVFQTKSKEFIGEFGINFTDNSNEVEIEYMLLPEYWGKGYGTEIVEKLLFKIKKMNTIQQVIAITDPNNIISKKLLLKHGFSSLKVYKIDDGSLAEMFIKSLSI